MSSRNIIAHWNFQADILGLIGRAFWSRERRVVRPAEKVNCQQKEWLDQFQLL